MPLYSDKNSGPSPYVKADVALPAAVDRLVNSDQAVGPVHSQSLRGASSTLLASKDVAARKLAECSVSKPHIEAVNTLISCWS